jgi:hypothetical protein
MSLDVYLTMKGETQGIGTEAVIYIRQNGNTIGISREEWDVLHPDREPITSEAIVEDDTVYSANITHNLSEMADAAGIYKHLWRPDEIGITKASELIEPLRAGLEQLQANPLHFQQFNPDNGWGSYEGLLRFVRDYWRACEEWPDAEVSVSR